MTPVDLSGKVVAITGAAVGLGAAYARECAARGARLALTDLDGEGLAAGVATLSGIEDPLTIVGDVADPVLSQELAAAAEHRWGRLDGWVNNAGTEVHAAADEIDPATSELMVRTNLLGTVYGTSAAARVMRRHGGGSIVNVTSGAHLGMRHLAVYGATKGAIASFTYGAAVDLVEAAIRVNAVMPLASTRMTAAGDAYFPGSGASVGAASRLAGPDAVACLVSYLLSDAAAELTSQVLRLDGQRLSVLRHPEVIVETALTRESWSAEEVAEAIAGPLHPSLHRAGAFESPAGRPG